jgi:hypothetical protein
MNSLLSFHLLIVTEHETGNQPETVSPSARSLIDLWRVAGSTE